MNEVLYLNNELYTMPMIKKAVLDYSNIAAITAKEKGNYNLCFFDKCKYDVETTKKEFANYVIDISNMNDLKWLF